MFSFCKSLYTMSSDRLDEFRIPSCHVNAVASLCFQLLRQEFFLIGWSLHLEIRKASVKLTNSRNNHTQQRSQAQQLNQVSNKRGKRWSGRAIRAQWTKCGGSQFWKIAHENGTLRYAVSHRNVRQLCKVGSSSKWASNHSEMQNTHLVGPRPRSSKHVLFTSWSVTERHWITNAAFSTASQFRPLIVGSSGSNLADPRGSGANNKTPGWFVLPSEVLAHWQRQHPNPSASSFIQSSSLQIMISSLRQSLSSLHPCALTCQILLPNLSPTNRARTTLLEIC